MSDELRRKGRSHDQGHLFERHDVCLVVGHAGGEGGSVGLSAVHALERSGGTIDAADQTRPVEACRPPEGPPDPARFLARIRGERSNRPPMVGQRASGSQATAEELSGASATPV